MIRDAKLINKSGQKCVILETTRHNQISLEVDIWNISILEKYIRGQGELEGINARK